MSTVRLRTLRGCGLAIGGYPRFQYDASQGGGPGGLGQPDGSGWCSLRFAPEQLQIPPLQSSTTRLLGLPLPPGLCIGIAPTLLQGGWHPPSGQLQLEFEACFRFVVAGRFRAPDLSVRTRLTSESASFRGRTVAGQCLDGNGAGVLVGVALVPPTGELWLDRFLGLPNQALAVLRCQLEPTA